MAWPELSFAMGALLFAAGAAAGIANAVAGGGTFFSFPVFLAAGLPPLVANASNVVAVWPGHALAAFGYRQVLRRSDFDLRWSLVSATLGGTCGALLLARVGNSAFTRIIPYLLLIATLSFAFGPALNRMLASRPAVQEHGAMKFLAQLCVFAICAYGGFFGAGFAIMLMAGLLLLGVHDLQQNNAIKNLVGALATTVAVLILAMSGLVSWWHTAIAFTGALAGGLAGARLARYLSAKWLRACVIAAGGVLTVYFFLK